MRGKELFQPIVLPKKGTGICFFFKVFLDKRSLNNARIFLVCFTDHFPLSFSTHSAVVYIISPSGNHHNHFASVRTVCYWPSAHLISTQIVTRNKMRSCQRTKMRLKILPRDTNTFAVAGLELTILVV